MDSATTTPSGVAYDANGNTLSDASGRQYTWDFENRLVSATNPGVGTTTFRYDPFGRRIQKSGALGTTNYTSMTARMQWRSWTVLGMCLPDTRTALLWMSLWLNSGQGQPATTTQTISARSGGTAGDLAKPLKTRKTLYSFAFFA
jgi:YD repeat-containing protein